MSVRAASPDGRSVGHQEGVIWYRARCGPICSVFREPLDKSCRQMLNIPRQRCLKWSNVPKGRVPRAMPVGECVFARRASSKARTSLSATGFARGYLPAGNSTFLSSTMTGGRPL